MAIGEHEKPNKGKTDIWYTPKWITDSLGDFDLDPCTNYSAPYYHAKTNYFYDLGECGITKSWDKNENVFMNPPYSKNEEFCKKLSEHGKGIALVYTRTETQWFKYLWMADSFFFFEGRLYFYDEKGNRSKGNAGAPSVLCAFGKENTERLFSFSLKHKGKFLTNNTR